MRKISDIYDEYKIIPSLQMHMLRVAAVAYLICDNISEPVDKEDIITACLLHDMGNIVKFKMNILPEFFEPEGVVYWAVVQKDFINRYGSDDHKANVKIAKELGLSLKIVHLVDQIDFPLWCNHQESNDLGSKIAIYSDARVGPHGILSYDERMEDAKRRYLGSERSKERQKLLDCGKEIESQIFAKCKIKPEDINDETVAPIISELRNFVIK